MVRIIIALTALTAAAPALAQDAPDWSIAAGGGTTTLENEGGQPFASLTLTRTLGDGYLSLTGTVVDSGDDDTPAGFLPARTLQGTLAGGYRFGELSADAYVSLGSRDFERGALAGPGGATIDFESSGSIFGAGLGLAYGIALGEDWLAAPFASVDYNSLDVSRVVAVPGRDPVAVRQEEDGVTGTAGLTLQRLFGGGRSSAGLYGAFVTTSNSASTARGASPAASARVGRLTDQPGTSDSWAEYGATAAIGLSDRLALDLSVVRTAGFAFGETTSFAAGLSLDF